MSTLDSLVKRFIDDQSDLSPDELDSLIAGLRAEPARAVALREQFVVDFLLAEKLTLDRGNFLAQVEQRIADHQAAEEEIDAQVLELRDLAAAEIELPAARRRNSAWMQGVLAAALLLVVAGVYFGPRLWPRQAVAMAKVKQVSGAVTATQNSQSSQLASTATIFAGQTLVTPPGGAVEIEYVDKTIVRIAADSRVMIDSDPASGAKRLRIDRGQLRAAVVRQTDGPMQLATPHARATVLGTEFRLAVGPDDTLLEVTEGRVQLDRLGENDSIVVAAHETGIASPERLHVRAVQWPDDTAGLAFAIDPIKRAGGQVRNQATGNWLAAEWQVVGSASQNDFTGVLDFSGGYFAEPQAGEDLAAMLRSGEALTLEIVLAPADSLLAAQIVTLAGSDGRPNVILSQEGDALSFALRTDGEGSLVPVRFALASNREPTHLTITYGSGELAIHQDGNPVPETSRLTGSLAAWSPGPLTLGAAPDGNAAWQGTIEALALYDRRLDAREVARNVRHYAMLVGRGP
jgi:ferric-dicitrate binding protein FerR (iron transport regulator)